MYHFRLSESHIYKHEIRSSLPFFILLIDKNRMKCDISKLEQNFCLVNNFFNKIFLTK